MGILFFCTTIFFKVLSGSPMMLRRLAGLLCLTSMACVALSANATATTLRPLADPDFSAFYAPTPLYQSGVAIDGARGWVYFYGAMTHVKGVRTSGIFRASLAGVIDYSWLPQNLKTLRSVTLADNGDVLAMLESEPVSRYLPSDDSLQYVDVVRITNGVGVPTVTTYRLPVAQPGTQFDYVISFTADAAWLYVALRGRQMNATGQEIVQTHLKRFSIANQLLDTTWQRVYDGQATFVGLYGGGLYLTYSREITSTQPKLRTIVERVGLARDAAPSWTVEIEGMSARKVLIDSAGRAYVLGNRYPNIQPFLAIHRFTTTGAPDPTWSVERANSVLPPGGWITNAVLVNQRLVVTTDGGEASPPTPPPPSAVLSFDDAGNGRIVRQFSKDLSSSEGAPFPNQLIVAAGKLLSVRSQSFEILNQETFATQATYVGLSTGGASTPRTVIRHADGSTSTVGYFSVWYEGQEFRNYIRYDANGIPDFKSRLADTVDVAYGRSAGVSASGAVVLAGARSAQTGAANFYVTATANTVARTLEISGSPILGAVGASASDSVWLYYVERPSAALQLIRRVAIDSGVRDASWEIKTARAANDSFETPDDIAVDKAGGIWLTHYGACLTGCLFIGLERFAIAAPDAPPYRLLARDLGLARFASQPLQFNTTHGYSGRFRYRLTDNMSRDATWETAQQPGFVDDRYAYFVTSRRLTDTVTETIINRASLTGNGAIDALWQRTIPGYPNLLSVRTDDNDNFFAHLAGAADASTTSAIYTDQNLAPAPQTVVEFYSPVANRYFITGRAADQAQLDQFPALYRRTGMRFETLSATFLGGASGPSSMSGLAEPTCRLYFSPARGGSNSHFYGTQPDCAIANTVKSFVYEGRDFGAFRPDGGVCPSAHPVGVTRLFNNRVASNEGNHRYVVGTRLINAMVATGWVQEQVVFCATRGTEAIN